MKTSERQQEIIEAAGRLLTTSGYSGLTIKNLAVEMKFSEAALYRHFPSKEKIILALLDYLASDMSARFSEISRTDQAPDKKLQALFQSQFSFFKSKPHLVAAVFADGLLEESEKINARIMATMQVTRTHLEKIISEGVSSKKFNDKVSADDLVHIIMGSFRLLMFKWRTSGFSFDLSRKGNNLLKSILTLIQAKK